MRMRLLFQKEETFKTKQGQLYKVITTIPVVANFNWQDVQKINALSNPCNGEIVLKDFELLTNRK